MKYNYQLKLKKRVVNEQTKDKSKILYFEDENKTPLLDNFSINKKL